MIKKFFNKVKDKINSIFNMSFEKKEYRSFLGFNANNILNFKMPNILDKDFKFPEILEIPDIEFPSKNDKNFNFTITEVKDDHFRIKTETATSKDKTKTFKRITKTLL